MALSADVQTLIAALGIALGWIFVLSAVIWYYQRELNAHKQLTERATIHGKPLEPKPEPVEQAPTPPLTPIKKSVTKPKTILKDPFQGFDRPPSPSGSAELEYSLAVVRSRRDLEAGLTSDSLILSEWRQQALDEGVGFMEDISLADGESSGIDEAARNHQVQSERWTRKAIPLSLSIFGNGQQASV
jgi:hypothetical protein